uniref:Uncharacterized protein n=1 Tax=Arundo donax TaxID=35708 RepID=A0A0A8ZII0_ARUDO
MFMSRTSIFLETKTSTSLSNNIMKKTMMKPHQDKDDYNLTFPFLG